MISPRVIIMHLTGGGEEAGGIEEGAARGGEGEGTALS